MNNDISYNENKQCKQEIENFINHISNIDFLKLDLKQYDCDFFAFISKHILFFKYLNLTDLENNYLKTIISDFYYYIISILKDEIRYMYLNERSILENYTRLITKTSINSDHVTQNSFDALKTFSNNLGYDISEYSLLHSEYTTSCGYVHGSEKLTHALSYVFDDCINHPAQINKRSNYYNRIKKVITYLDKLLIHKYPDFISGCFHRRKTLLSYLLGEQNVDLLFNSIDKKK